MSGTDLYALYMLIHVIFAGTSWGGYCYPFLDVKTQSQKNKCFAQDHKTVMQECSVRLASEPIFLSNMHLFLEMRIILRKG